MISQFNIDARLLMADTIVIVTVVKLANLTHVRWEQLQICFYFKYLYYTKIIIVAMK
jgi:hypothetical protein